MARLLLALLFIPTLLFSFDRAKGNTFPNIKVLGLFTSLGDSDTDLVINTTVNRNASVENTITGLTTVSLNGLGDTWINSDYDNSAVAGTHRVVIGTNGRGSSGTEQSIFWDNGNVDLKDNSIYVSTDITTTIPFNKIGVGTTDLSSGYFVIGGTKTASPLHSFRDQSYLNGTQQSAYACIDIEAEMTGPKDYDHFIALQCRPIFSGSTGLTSRFDVIHTIPVINGTGTVTNVRGVHIGDVGGSGGTITNNYGLYIDNITKGVENYSIYTTGGKHKLSGNLEIASSTAGDLLTVNNYFRQSDTGTTMNLPVNLESYFSSNVGIGKVPNGRFHVNGANNYGILIENDSESHYSLMLQNRTVSTNFSAPLYIYQVNTGRAIIGNAGDNCLILGLNGEVSVGDTTPDCRFEVLSDGVEANYQMRVSSNDDVGVLAGVKGNGILEATGFKANEGTDWGISISSPYSVGFGTGTFIPPFRGYAITITTFTAAIDGGTNVAFRLEQRHFNNAKTSGIDIAGAITATSAGWIGGTIADATLPADTGVFLVITGVTGNVDKFMIRGKYTRD